MRYACLIEYEGTSFCGWQDQPGSLTVQGCLQKAGLQLTGFHLIFCGAGRTDAGVHARGQVAHFDLEKEYTLDSLRRGLNFYLKPYPIIIRKVIPVGNAFHARFSALWRQYCYHIINRPSPCVLMRQRALWQHKPLDIVAMNTAARLLIGHRNFSSFRSQKCQSKSAFKTLDALTVMRKGENVYIHAKAKSFLHNQVRIMVGGLCAVGSNKINIDQWIAMRDACSRVGGAITAPPFGLYLERVGYDQALFD